jgi:hypothetical protein
MNKFKTAALFGLATTGAAFAGDLWGANTDDFPSLQVQTPDAIECWAENTKQEATNPCYNGTGGWWFLYGDPKAGVGTDWSVTPNDEDASDPKLVMTDEETGDVIEGGNIVDGALHVELMAAAGASDAPKLAGIGFNWKADPIANEWDENTTIGTDISSKGGLCLTYESDGSLQLELGWQEDKYGYDTYFVTLPAQSSKKTMDIPWDDFKKDDWAAMECNNPTGAMECDQPLETATKKAVSVKFRNKNTKSSAVTVTFDLYELGWEGTCDGKTPVIGATQGAGAAAKLNLAGRTLSFSKLDKAVEVQLINMNGSVVASQLVAPAKSMSLSKLPVGIYMVRVPDLGITSKVMLK